MEENRRRGRRAPEFELIDTGVFDDDRYWDVTVEYAKAGVDDILVRITAANRGPEAGRRSTSCRPSGSATRGPGTRAPSGRGSGRGPARGRPPLRRRRAPDARRAALAPARAAPRLLFTENETNHARLFGAANRDAVREGRHRRGHRGPGARTRSIPRRSAPRPARTTAVTVPAGRRGGPAPPADRPAPMPGGPFGRGFDAVVDGAPRRGRRVLRRRCCPPSAPRTPAACMRQACGRAALAQAVLPLRRRGAGSRAIPRSPAPPPERAARPEPRVAAPLQRGRDLDARQVGVPLVRGLGPRVPHDPARARLDPDFAKSQLVLFLREWYMHPNGQIPAYEWAFGDVNPPVHAWAAWRVYKIDRRVRGGKGDRRVPREGVPQAAAELHVVGEPQGCRGQERVPGRLPRARQHRRLRPVRAAPHRRPHRAVRRDELDGHVLR